MYSDYVLIKKDTLIGIADAIREVSDTTDLIDPANMKYMILGNSGSGGSGGPIIENGFTVNFYNAENVLAESHSALYGMYIDEPISFTSEGWVDEKGQVVILPMTLTEGNTYNNILNLYTLGGSMEMTIVDPNGTTFSSTCFSAPGIPQSGVKTTSSGADVFLFSYDTVYRIKTSSRVNSMIVFNDAIKCSGYKSVAIKYLYFHGSSSGYDNAWAYVARDPIGEAWGTIAASNCYSTAHLVNSNYTHNYYVENYGNDYLNNEEAYKWVTLPLNGAESFYMAFHACTNNLYIREIKLIG